MKSEAQITQERQAWARGVLIIAWEKVEQTAKVAALLPGESRGTADRAMEAVNNGLLDAVAIVQEWGLDASHVLESIGFKAILGGER
jgi:hypothetical protein